MNKIIWEKKQSSFETAYLICDYPEGAGQCNLV